MLFSYYAHFEEFEFTPRYFNTICFKLKFMYEESTTIGADAFESYIKHNIHTRQNNYNRKRRYGRTSLK